MNTQANNEEVNLPPREPNFEALNAQRVYRTGLSARYYLDMEKECAQRTTVDKKMTPYSLTSLVMTLYLQRKLVYLKDLPEDLRQAIQSHYR